MAEPAQVQVEMSDQPAGASKRVGFPSPEKGAPGLKHQSTANMLPVSINIFKPNPDLKTKNTLTTSKYTLITFLPFCLWELLHPQRRFANFFYLCVGGGQLIPAISPTGGSPQAWMSLFIIVMIDMIILARDDINRHKADHEANTKPVDIITIDEHGAPSERRATWADVKVGEVVRVLSKEAFPADLVLLRGSDPPGQCWVNTKPLDGESDMKLRLAPHHGLSPAEATPGQPLAEQLNWGGLRGIVRTEKPNDKVNDFTGELVLDGHNSVMVSSANMLLRGCVLQNTDWILGLVVSCGTDTKINYGGKATAAQKKGLIAKKLNTMIGLEVALVFAFCLVGASVAQAPSGGFAWYIFTQPDGYDIRSNWFILLMSYFLSMYSMIPATLFVAGNGIYLVSSHFIRNDLEMYDAEGDEPCQVRTMTLLDELGQVSHIFSDKTGTLTSNHMEFRRVLIDGISYGVGDTAISRSLRERKGNADLAPELRDEPPPAWCGCRPKSATYVSFEQAKGAPDLLAELIALSEDGAMRRELIVHLALNHSVMLDDGHLSASSPDEQAFVAAAEYFGLEFCERHDDKGYVVITDKRSGVTHTVHVLTVFPYESSRKRMSMVVRLPDELLDSVGGGERIRLYSKGADSVLLTLLAEGSRGTDAASMDQLNDTLNEWAEVALRTLVFAKREITTELWQEWLPRYEQASSSPAEIAKMRKGEPNRIQALQMELEANLILQGATAIEDKLQDGVPEILADLRKAGIKIWMLTGDKVGTAKNIAMACNILPATADVLEITCETFAVLNEISASKMVSIQRKIEAVGRGLGHHISKDEGSEGESRRDAGESFFVRMGTNALEWAARCFDDCRTDRAETRRGDAMARIVQQETARLDAKLPELAHVRAALVSRLPELASGEASELCLVLDEKAIEYCGTLCKHALAAVGNGARSVVACRARKDQKAQMLNLIKTSVPESCCLAIGDGANDVAMIQEGQIGVGIIGKEGMQAVNNSDFAIGQFRFLRHLLLVHGRQCYRRMAIFNYFVLYKGTVLPLSSFLFSMHALASAGIQYTQFYYNWLFSLVLTIYPVSLLGVNDFDVPKHIAASAPHLYTSGIERKYFNLKGFSRWCIEAIFAALVATYLPNMGQQGLLNNQGSDQNGYWFASWTGMVIITVGVNLRLLFEITSWTCFEHLTMWGCLLLFQAFLLIFSYVWYPSGGAWDTTLLRSMGWNEYHGFIEHAYTSAEWWLVVIMAVTLFVAPRMVGKAAQKGIFYPLTVAKRVRRGLPVMPSGTASSTEDIHDAQELTVQVSSFARGQKSMAERAGGRMLLPSQQAIDHHLSLREESRVTAGSRTPATPSSLQRQNTFAFSENAETAARVWEASRRSTMSSTTKSPLVTDHAPADLSLVGVAACSGSASHSTSLEQFGGRGSAASSIRSEPPRLHSLASSLTGSSFTSAADQQERIDDLSAFEPSSLRMQGSTFDSVDVKLEEGSKPPPPS